MAAQWLFKSESYDNCNCVVVSSTYRAPTAIVSPPSWTTLLKATSTIRRSRA
jgi:hypothetical protein